MSRLKVSKHQKPFKELSLKNEKPYYIGRREDCDIILDAEPGISRQHLKLEFIDNCWVVSVLSPHIPIYFDNKNQNKIVCPEGTTHFQLSNYNFELICVNMSSDSAKDSVSERILEPLNSNAPPSSAVDPEISFHGNEEQTSDIQISGEPYLKFMYSSHSESIRLKGNKWSAGRDSIAQIQLDDKKASRQHFTIEKVGEIFYIKDLQSANGTLLNGQELVPHEARELKSGDIITVNQLTMIFELRDLSFSEKLKDLPLQAYSGPMILSSQDWDLNGVVPLPSSPRMETDKLAQISGHVEKVNLQPKNHLRTVLMALVALIVVGYGAMNMDAPPPEANKEGSVKTFESLSPEEKKFVVDSYNSAQGYYQEGRIQNALTQISYVHKTLPFYKDSRELESRFIEAQETLRQKEFIAQQRREQEQTRLRVQGIIGECRDRYRDSVDVTAAKSCLSEALQLDPDNSDAQSVVAEVELRLSQAQEAEKKLREFNDSVERAREMFTKAKNLLQNKDYHEAISAFSAHMNSNLPDPDHLKKVSERSVASIEKHIRSQKQTFMGRARYQINSGNLKEAYFLAEQAKKVDPYDYDITNFIEQTRRSLETKMKPLYEESVIEERFGNFEICKNKWREIVAKDIPTGEYYLKAKRKLLQYGL